MDIQKNFAEKLSELLEETGTTPDALSKATGLNLYEIYHWKAGNKFMPSVTNLLKIADYFHCTLDYLLGLTEANHFTSSKPISNFSKRFSHIVKSEGWSLYKLSKATKMCTTTYYDWINGKREPSVDSLVRVAQALECSVDYLLGRDK